MRSTKLIKLEGIGWGPPPPIRPTGDPPPTGWPAKKPREIIYPPPGYGGKKPRVYQPPVNINTSQYYQQQQQQPPQLQTQSLIPGIENKTLLLIAGGLLIFFLIK